MSAEELLTLDGVSVAFGGVQALADVSLTVRAGEVHGLIGPNGAGKTTLFNVVCGFVRPGGGGLVWKGRRAGAIRPHLLARHGIARTLQGLGLFDRMSVLENVMVGADRHARTGFWSALAGVGRGPREEARLRDRALAALADLDISAYADRYPGSLPYPVRKKVALARALAAEPELLLLDEPASGLSATEMDELADVVRGVAARATSTAVLLVEHHMDLVMAVCDRVTVLDFGRVIADGTPDQIREHPAVVAAYLGDVIDGDGQVDGVDRVDESDRVAR